MKSDIKVIASEIYEMTRILKSKLDQLENDYCGCKDKVYFPMVEYDPENDNYYIDWRCLNCGGSKLND